MSSSKSESWPKRLMCNLSEMFFKSKKERLSDRIHKACSEYDYQKLSKLIEYLGTPDALNKVGETPLYLASVKGVSSEPDRKMVKFLIEKGANILQYSPNKCNTPASYIVQYEDQNLIDLVLRRIGDINSPLDKYKNTALHLAVAIANETTVLKLLKLGANPNQTNNHKTAAIHEAVTSKGCKILKLLVTHGGDINLRGNYDYTPLHLATLMEIEIAKTSERTLAAYSNENRTGQILDKILELKPNMNARDRPSNTALAIYLRCSPKVHEEDVNKFLNAGTDPSLRDQTGMNVLHRLVHRNKCPEPHNLVEKIIKQGVDINSYTYFNEDTALHIAAAFGHTEFVHILLTKNANMFVQNIRGRTPMDLAIFAENSEVIQIMYSFIIRYNLPLNGLMMDYHKTNDSYKSIVDIHNTAMIEYERCKTTRIYSPWKVYYSDLLVMSEKKFAKLLRNITLLSNLNDYLIDLRAFSFSYKKVYKAAKIRRDAEDAAVLHLQKIWKNSLPINCIEIIVDYMKTEELKVYLDSQT